MAAILEQLRSHRSQLNVNFLLGSPDRLKQFGVFFDEGLQARVLKAVAAGAVEENLYRSTQQWFSSANPVGGLEQSCQIVKGYCYPGMLRPEALFVNSENPPL